MIYKHAYLIMAHEQFPLLIKLLSDLDDERNDIFLHIDLKSHIVPLEKITKSVKRANLYLVERMSVNWGGYSQIECELRLLENALRKGTYLYYHFLCGTEFPLKSQDYIHEFFAANRGAEFIEYDMHNEFIKRVRYYYFFNECGRPRPRHGIRYIKRIIRQVMIKLQKCIGIDMTKKYDITFMKGNANWSITENLAKVVVEKKEEIQKMYAHSFCADEVYLHTIVYNSPFYEKVYRDSEGKTTNMRKQQWERKDNCYYMEELEYLLSSHALFARKFSGVEGEKVINQIIKLR